MSSLNFSISSSLPHLCRSYLCAIGIQLEWLSSHVHNREQEKCLERHSFHPLLPPPRPPSLPGILISGRAEVNNFTWFIARSGMDGFFNCRQREQLLQNQLNHMKAKKIPRLQLTFSIRKLSLHGKFQMLNSAFCNVKHLAVQKISVGYARKTFHM